MRGMPHLLAFSTLLDWEPSLSCSKRSAPSDLFSWSVKMNPSLSRKSDISFLPHCFPLSVAVPVTQMRLPDSGISALAIAWFSILFDYEWCLQAVSKLLVHAVKTFVWWELDLSPAAHAESSLIILCVWCKLTSHSAHSTCQRTEQASPTLATRLQLANCLVVCRVIRLSCGFVIPRIHTRTSRPKPNVNHFSGHF